MASEPLTCADGADYWFCAPITNPHSKDDGVDIGDSDRTPLAFPFGGKIIDLSYHVYGGQVVAEVPGTDYSEYFIHTNINPNLHVGDTVQPGDLIGTSGGGVGDLILHDGVVQPAQSQSWYEGHSSGYHTELGIFEGQDMPSFNEGWGDKARQLDPTGILQSLRNGQAPIWPGPGNPPPPGPNPIPGGGSGVGGWLSGIIGSIFPVFNDVSNPALIKWRVTSLAFGAGGLFIAGLGVLEILVAMEALQVKSELSLAAPFVSGAVTGGVSSAVAGAVRSTGQAVERTAAPVTRQLSYTTRPVTHTSSGLGLKTQTPAAHIASSASPAPARTRTPTQPRGNPVADAQMRLARLQAQRKRGGQAQGKRQASIAAEADEDAARYQQVLRDQADAKIKARKALKNQKRREK